MPKILKAPDKVKAPPEELFIVLCASGFDSPERVRSALMFSTLAAAAEYSTVLFCVQGAVDVLVKGAIEKHESPNSALPSISQRLKEAIDMGVRIQCCSQSMANRKLNKEDMLEGVEIEGAMSLIELTSRAKGNLCF